MPPWVTTSSLRCTCSFMQAAVVVLQMCAALMTPTCASTPPTIERTPPLVSQMTSLDQTLLVHTHPESYCRKLIGRAGLPHYATISKRKFKALTASQLLHRPFWHHHLAPTAAAAQAMLAMRPQVVSPRPEHLCTMAALTEWRVETRLAILEKVK